MGCVPRVSGFQTRQRLKCYLECDMCHLSEWATCPFLMFRHGDLLSSMGGGALMVIVARGTSCEIQRLGTPEECFIRERKEELSKVL
jgi:hypothetical protein